MKLLFVIRKYADGGIERIISNISNQIEIDVLTLQEPSQSMNFKNNYVFPILDKNIGTLSRIINKVTPFYGNRFFSGYFKERFKQKLNEIEIENGKYDYIIFSGFGCSSILYKFNDPRLRVWCHSNKTELIKEKYNKYFMRSASKFIFDVFDGKKIICVSDGVKSDLQRNFLVNGTMKTVYNFVSKTDLINKSCENITVGSNSYILFIGRLVSLKRVDFIIRAYEKSDIQHKFLILGDGPEQPNLMNLVEQLGLKDKVVFLGFKQNPYPYIRNASTVVLASEREGLPTVLIESLILGTSVVSVDCPSGPKEILGDEYVGLIKDADEEKFASLIKYQVVNQELPCDFSPDKYSIQHFLDGIRDI
ncbi:glycosyltransferase [Vibrio breoganii]